MRLAVTPSPPVPNPPSQSPPGSSPGQSWGPVWRPSRLVFILLPSSLLLIAVWVACWPGLKLSSALTSARTISSAFDSLSFDRLSRRSDLYSLIRRVGPTTPSLVHSLPLRAVSPITQSQATPGLSTIKTFVATNRRHSHHRRSTRFHRVLSSRPHCSALRSSLLGSTELQIRSSSKSPTAASPALPPQNLSEFYSAPISTGLVPIGTRIPARPPIRHLKIRTTAASRTCDATRRATDSASPQPSPAATAETACTTELPRHTPIFTAAPRYPAGTATNLSRTALPCASLDCR